mmetsp:Transcript_29972/g.75510  ORF Transcript_29972/g.75510 Transcript_29972/m.75510 type:complete len:307 (-) Transcript_29972:31-951(-)
MPPLALRRPLLSHLLLAPSLGGRRLLDRHQLRKLLHVAGYGVLWRLSSRAIVTGLPLRCPAPPLQHRLLVLVSHGKEPHALEAACPDIKALWRCCCRGRRLASPARIRAILRIGFGVLLPRGPDVRPIGRREDVRRRGGPQERGPAGVSPVVQPLQEERFLGAVLRDQHEPGLAAPDGEAEAAVDVVPREGGIRHQHVEVGARPRRRGGVEVFVLVVHVREAQVAEERPDPALAEVGVVDAELGGGEAEARGEAAQQRGDVCVRLGGRLRVIAHVLGGETVRCGVIGVGGRHEVHAAVTRVRASGL